jgi:hypothetical protein
MRGWQVLLLAANRQQLITKSLMKDATIEERRSFMPKKQKRNMVMVMEKRGRFIHKKF